MNPLLWIVGRRSSEADRQPFDPGPIRQPKSVQTQRNEAFTRHLRARGRRIAIGRTFVPPGWTPAPELESKLVHEAAGSELRWSHHFRKWKEEMKVGKNR